MSDRGPRHETKVPPSNVDPRGVPREGDGHDGFILLLAFVVAVLALIFTLGWVVYHQLTG